MDFLIFDYFKITPDEFNNGNLDCIILKCAKRAYLDLNRTLRFSKDSNAKEHDSFCDEISKQIRDRIIKELPNITDKNFDEIHNDICNKIVSLARNYKGKTDSLVLSVIKNNKNEKIDQKIFYYGQAQKWLNMTLKYMYLLGFWDDDFKRFSKVLHVPIDNYIIEAVWHEGETENNKIKLKNKIWLIKIPSPYGDSVRKNKYNQEIIISWSKWSEDEYKDFQIKLRKHPLLEGKSPLEWENDIWIKIASSK